MNILEQYELHLVDPNNWPENLKEAYKRCRQQGMTTRRMVNLICSAIGNRIEERDVYGTIPC